MVGGIFKESYSEFIILTPIYISMLFLDISGELEDDHTGQS